MSPVSTKDWPNLFVAGAARAGTTSLWSYLRQHPQIFMSKLKEPHFFSRVAPPLVRVVHNEVEYKGLFEDGRGMRYRGEASPSYLFEGVAEAIARVQPDSRIVISLRDPITRAHSSYRRRARDGLEQGSFLDFARVIVAPGPALDYLGAQYTPQVERYLRAFPGGVHVLVFEELVADPRDHLDRLFGFLEVEPLAGSLDLTPLNPGHAPRNAVAQKLYTSSRARDAAHALIPPAFHARVERVMLDRRSEPAIDPDARRLLADHYAPDREPLERLLGRSLPWSRRV